MYFVALAVLLHLSGVAHACSPAASFKDWSVDDGTKLTGEIRNMASCRGSHWAFAVAAQVESDAKRKDSSFDDVLSPQQLLDCVTSNFGCSVWSATPDSLVNAFTYLEDTRGLQTNSQYSYKVEQKKCKAKNDKHLDRDKVKVDGIYRDLTGDEACMANYVQTTGPLAACLTTGANIKNYDGANILTATTCLASAYWGPFLDTHHYTVCGQIVGVNLVAGTDPYWKFRVSAGTNWGDAGYAKIAYGSNACSVSQNPIYTSVLLKDSGEF